MLQEFEKPFVDQLAAVRASSCYVTKSYRLSDERNAWQWSTSRSYPGSEAYKQDFGAAKKAVEQRRLQGSRWWIREIPSIVVQGGDYCILIATPLPLRPLAEFSDVEFQAPFIGAIASAALPLGYVFMCARPPDVAQFPFCSFVSHVRTGRRPLGWISRNEKRDLTYLSQLLAKLQTTMQSQ